METRFGFRRADPKPIPYTYSAKRYTYPNTTVRGRGAVYVYGSSLMRFVSGIGIPRRQAGTGASRGGRHSQRLRQAATAALLCLLACIVTLPAAQAKTIATHYSYNADGALTAIKKEENGNVTMTYVTWDDFVPDANDPTTGTVKPGNGTMDGFGPSPGAAQFEFDARNRLIDYQANGVDESYSYRADGMMASSSAGGATRRFYYEDSQNAQVTNIYQDGSDLWSSYLEGVRYLSDGTEQVLFRPRKDVACTYEAQAQKLQSYTYDAFGSQSQAPLQSTYNLHDNPFQYSGEYRDPMWGGVYLRARWYQPDLPIFMSRDPMAHLNRYGYGGGNPIMHSDPSGMSFWRSLGKGLKKANDALNKGWWGHLDRFFLSPLMSALSIAADPKGFWNSIRHDKDGITAFLIAGVAVQVASWGLEGAGVSALVRNLSFKVRYATRLTIDSGLAIGQAVAAGADRGFRHFNWESAAESLELGVGGLLYSRGLVGEGFNQYTLRATDVAKMIENAADDKLLIFRARTPLATKIGITSPLTEKLKTSFYHESLVAVSKDYLATTEVTVENDVGYIKRWAEGARRPGVGKPIDAKAFFTEETPGRFQFVGELEKTKENIKKFGLNPLHFPSEPEPSEYTSKYRVLRNNCHYHAQAVLKELGLW
jgi:RHS repeat-associated protein